MTVTGIPMWLATRQLRDRARRHAAGGRVAAVRASDPAGVTFLRAKNQISACLAIGLGSDARCVRDAVELARQLEAARVHVPQSARALGLGALLADQAYVDAGRHLLDAFSRGLRDPDLMIGLLTALIRTGQAKQARHVAAEAGPIANWPAAELAEAGTAIAWLDDVMMTGPPPAGSGRLRELTVAGGLIGEWLAYAIGRMLLIEGEARGAAEILAPLARAHPARQAWAYYAATALALCNDAEAVAGLLRARRRQPGDWAIDCVLADLGAAGEPKPSGADGYASVVTTRAALSGCAPLPVPGVPWSPGPGTHAENLEAYRAHLALLLARGDRPGLAEEMARPAFARLPAADRMLWSAFTVPAAATHDLRALLARADQLGHPRAGLALAVLDLSNSAEGASDDLLSRAVGRSPALAGLLQAWALARAGRHEDAAARLTPLAAAGDPRAHYALGSVRLLQVARASAAGNQDETRDHAASAAAEFRAVPAAGPTRFDGEATALMCAAELIATGTTSSAAPPDGTAPSPADTRGSAGTRWPRPADGSWQQWTVAITELASGRQAPDMTTIASLYAALDQAGPPPAPAVNAAAVLVAQAALRSRDGADAGALHDMLFELARRFGAQPASRDLIRLVLGLLFLGDGARSQELTGQQLPHGLRLAIGSLLQPQPDVPVAPVMTGPAAAAARVLLAGTERAPDPRRWGEALLALSREQDISTVVYLPKALPALCAAAGGGAARAIPEQLAAAVQALVASPPDEPGSLLAARCATAIRDYDSAFRLWVRVLGDHGGTLPASLGDECARAQRYGAALALQRGEALRAVSMLRLAALVAVPDDASAADRDRGLADELELQTCAQRLITTLFPGTAREPDRPGRHRVLEEAVVGLPPLRRSLLTGNCAGVTTVWTSYLREHRADIRLPHSLAVLYREHAFASPDAPESEGWLIRATTLWCLLVCTDEFWRRAPGQGQRAQLTELVATELLERHARIGAHAYKAGQRQSAAAHLRVLADCRDGRAALLRRLEADLKLAWPWREGGGGDRVSAAADRCFSEWHDAVITEAERVRDDIADADLPVGISKNYAGAIALLDEFATLGVPVTRIARLGLAWSTYLCRANQDADAESGYRKNLEIIQRAGKFADQLVAVCTRGESTRGENQALSNYFAWRAWLTANTSEKCRHLRESVSWNPANDYAAGRLRANNCAGEE